MLHRTIVVNLMLLVIASLPCPAGGTAAQDYHENPFIIRLDIPAPQDSPGGILVADLDNDGRMDYLVALPWQAVGTRTSTADAYSRKDPPANNTGKPAIVDMDHVSPGSSDIGFVGSVFNHSFTPEGRAMVLFLNGR